jgi:pimeloyl-ACP methyl ester carboxylesterase
MGRIVVSEETLLLQLPGLAATIHLRITQPATPTATLVFVPDFAGTCRDFDDAALFFAAQDIRAVSFDMPGRGQSAFLSPDLYRIRVYQRVIASVLERFARQPLTLFGAGWGGAMALAFGASLKGRRPRLVLGDLPVQFSVATDEGMNWFRTMAGRTFAERAEAEAAAAQWPALKHLPEPARLKIAHHRVGRVGENFRLHTDPALKQSLDQVGDQVFDLGPLLAAVPGALVFCKAGDGWQTLGDRLRKPGLVLIEQAGEKSHCGLTDPGDRLTVMGYMAAREIGSIERDQAEGDARTE